MIHRARARAHSLKSVVLPRIDQTDLISTRDNFAITSLTSGWQIAKGGKGALIYSRITVDDGKGRRLQ